MGEFSHFWPSVAVARAEATSFEQLAPKRLSQTGLSWAVLIAPSPCGPVLGAARGSSFPRRSACARLYDRRASRGNCWQLLGQMRARTCTRATWARMCLATRFSWACPCERDDMHSLLNEAA